MTSTTTAACTFCLQLPGGLRHDLVHRKGHQMHVAAALLTQLRMICLDKYVHWRLKRTVIQFHFDLIYYSGNSQLCTSVPAGKTLDFAICFVCCIEIRYKLAKLLLLSLGVDSQPLILQFRKVFYCTEVCSCSLALLAPAAL
jgi:hypothetical protein